MSKTETITVIVDKAEQRPLLFPETLALWTIRGAGHVPKARIVRVKIERRRLDAGDYCLVGDEALAIVERKAHIGELITNTLTADRPRFLRALERLAVACKYPYLYVERFPAPWWTQENEEGYSIQVVQAMDLLLTSITRLNIRLLWSSHAAITPRRRRRDGELILRILLAHREHANGKQSN